MSDGEDNKQETNVEGGKEENESANQEREVLIIILMKTVILY